MQHTTRTRSNSKRQEDGLAARQLLQAHMSRLSATTYCWLLPAAFLASQPLKWCFSTPQRHLERLYVLIATWYSTGPLLAQCDTCISAARRTVQHGAAQAGATFQQGMVTRYWDCLCPPGTWGSGVCAGAFCRMHVACYRSGNALLSCVWVRWV